jgi:hypothetical protein
MSSVSRALRHDFGDLGFSHPCGSFDQEGFFQFHGQEDGHHDGGFGDVALLGQHVAYFVQGRMIKHRLFFSFFWPLKNADQADFRCFDSLGLNFPLFNSEHQL